MGVKKSCALWVQNRQLTFAHTPTDSRHVRALNGANGNVGVSDCGSESCGNRDCNYRTPDIAAKGPEPSSKLSGPAAAATIFHARLPKYCPFTIRHFASDNRPPCERQVLTFVWIDINFCICSQHLSCQLDLLKVRRPLKLFQLS